MRHVTSTPRVTRERLALGGRCRPLSRASVREGPPRAGISKHCATTQDLSVASQPEKDARGSVGRHQPPQFLEPVLGEGVGASPHQETKRPGCPDLLSALAVTRERLAPRPARPLSLPHVGRVPWGCAGHSTPSGPEITDHHHHHPDHPDHPDHHHPATGTCC